MDKSPDAFRTISEVADALETPAHVLRFWESRFPQIRPVKRAGGRRYYRPADVALLTGIKRLLHDEGMTIRGVQKILREQGIRHVSGLSDDSSPEEEALDAAMSARFDSEPDLPSEVVEDKTAAALAAALDSPPEARVVPFAPVSPPEPEVKAEDLSVADAPAPDGQDGQDAGLIDDTLPVTPDDGETELTEDLPPRGDFFDFATPPAAPDPQNAPPDAAEPPHAPAQDAVVARPTVTLPPADSTDPDEEITATLAARLRALPRGALSARHEALIEIAARIAALRDRLGGLPPRS